MSPLSSCIFERKLCRACLVTGDNNTFYELKENMRYFVDFLKIELDGLAIYWLCHLCHHRISAALNFADKVQTADLTLGNIFDKRRHSRMMLSESIKIAHQTIGFPKLRIKIIPPLNIFQDQQQERLKSEETPLLDVALALSTLKCEDNSDSCELKSDYDDRSIKSDPDGEATNAGDECQFAPAKEKSSRELRIEKVSENDRKVLIVDLSRDEQLEAFQKLRKHREYLDAAFKCKLCFKGFRLGNVYAKHKEKHNKVSGQYECDICHQFKATPQQFKRHLITHTRLYKCVVCDYTRQDRTSILKHFEAEHDLEELQELSRLSDLPFEPKLETFEAKKKVLVIDLTRAEQVDLFRKQALQKRYVEALFKCELCLKGFLYKETYQVHMERHSKLYGEHECDICHIHKKTVGQLRQHMSRHAKMFKCPLCDFVKYGRGTIIDHYEAKHEGGATENRCVVCGREFSNTSLLSKHMKYKHTDTKVECVHCGKQYASKDVLRLHIRTRHVGVLNPELEKRFICDVCGKRFRVRSNLKLHSAWHSDKRSFYCVECDLSFKTAVGLHNHLNTTKKHANAATLEQCEQCPSRFVNKRQLREHTEMVHLGIATFKCSLCPKAFYRNSRLNLHRKRVHEGLKPDRKHSCDLCGKSFMLKKDLSFHMNVHTGERPYKCISCEATFMYPAALYTHNRLVHLKIKRKCDLKKSREKYVNKHELIVNDVSSK